MRAEIRDQLMALSELVTNSESPDAIHTFLKQHFHLPGNPFPPSGIADATEDNPPLRPDITSEILHFIKASYRSRQFRSMIVSGEYGMGKTHTLRFIEQVVNTFMSKGDESARAIYVERPRIEAHELNRTILRSLGYDTVRKYVWFVIRGVLMNEIKEESESFRELKRKLTLPARGRGQARPTMTPRLWNEEAVPVPAAFKEVFNAETITDYRSFLRALEDKGWDREQVRYYLVDCLVKATGEDVFELAQVFVALLLARDETSFASWETLVSISKTKALSSLRAPTFLQFLLRIMHRNGITYVYLLLDEFEEVPQTGLLSPRQRQEYLYTVREVFDKIREGLAVVIAITPGALTALTELATPLADRNVIRVDLPPIEVEDAVKLVQFYFDREREGPEFKKVRKGDMKPLSRDLIAYILNNFPPNAQKTPRSLIQFFHRLLNYAAQNNIAVITQEVVQSLLGEFGSMKSSQNQPPKRRR